MNKSHIKNVEKFNYQKERGLIDETLRRFGCGYLPAGTEGGKTKLFGGWWLYCPTGINGCSGNCRAIKEKDFRNFGSKELFNYQALHQEIVIVVESEICVMTIYQETNANVIGLSGTPNVKKFIKAIQMLEYNPKIIIVMTDNDGKYEISANGKGKGAALEIIQGLNKLGVFTFDAIPYLDDCKDPNEYFLKHEGKAFRAMISEVLATAQENFKDWTPLMDATESPEQQNNEIDEFDKQSAIQAAETQKAVEILQSITDFSKDIIYSEEVLHAADLCYIYAIKDFEEFREKCDKRGIRVRLLDSKVKTYAKPIQKEKDRREKQRWIKLKENEYKRKQQEREQKRLKNIGLLERLANDKNADKEKVINLIRSSLERDYKGRLLNNTRNFNLIIYNDPYLKSCVGFDAFSYRMVPMRTLPWSDKLITDVAWRDSDDSGMQNYIDMTYNLRNDKVFRGAIDEYARKHSFHPVRDFFNKLPEWDGKERAEKVFIDALEVEDSEYARKVTLHWLLGGVARIFNPGCKFDYTIVTKGKQGIGKSTILRKLAANPDWFNDSLDSFEGKDALEQLQGSWIIEIGEMQATRKSENEKIKSFISRQVDEFRKAYGHRKESYPRQCIFSATTNSEEFLKDRTGGRRFLILVSEAKTYNIKKRMEKFTPDYILQIWAEVYHIYNEMFKDDFDDSLLDIPAHLKNIAKEYQDRYTEGGALAGFVTEYLDKEFPIN